MQYPSMPWLLMGSIVSIVTLIAFKMLSKERYRSTKLPPGPKGLPFLGYINTIKTPIFKTFHRWSLHYGSDVIHFNVLGTNVIVANTYQAATDLLDKRSSIYSDRSTSCMVMLYELCGFSWGTTLAPYAPYWRDTRKALHHAFNPDICSIYRPIQLNAIHRLLFNLVKSPEDFRDHIRLLFGSMTMEVSYGLEVKDANNPYIVIAEKAVQIVSACIVPGAFWVDIVPMLKYVPAWFPGASFKRKAAKWKELGDTMLNKPYDAYKMSTDDKDCAAKIMHERMSEEWEAKDYSRESVIKGALATAYAAAADTSTSTLAGFFLMMTLHPDIQLKAQRSIDRACQGRLPEFSDSAALPYIHALAKECLRYNPVGPFGLPHMVTTDDVYDGYFIPAKSTVIANVWAILHDPVSYPNPESFSPDRFLRPSPDSEAGVEINPEVLDPDVAAFGFGRRICPGRHLAYESLWLCIASILAVFDISKAMDNDGNPITPSGEYTDTFISTPKEFTCIVKPRSSKCQALIEAASGLHEDV